MRQIEHEVDGTTYFACDECGACPCRRHNRDHSPGCSHRIPPQWYYQECAQMGKYMFMLCSACQRPPCRLLDRNSQ